jgi:nucleoid DNA-binding protein
MRIYRRDLIQRTWQKSGHKQDTVKTVINTFLDELSTAIIKGEAVTLTRVASFFPHKLKDTYLWDFQQEKVVEKKNRWIIKCLLADDILSKFKEWKRENE